MKSTKLLAAAAFCLAAQAMSAQDVGVKTNLINDALLNPSLGIEVGLAPHWTLDVSGQANFWKLNRGKRWKHWMAQPEVRYWLCDRFQGHFAALHLMGGQYNIGHIKGLGDFLGNKFSDLESFRYQGWFAGAGIAYGYAWALGKHWNIEAELGIGWAYSRYDKYECATCGDKLEDNRVHNYVGPTKAALNIVYLF